MKVVLWAETLAYPVASVQAWADLVETQVTKADGAVRGAWKANSIVIKE